MKPSTQTNSTDAHIVPIDGSMVFQPRLFSEPVQLREDIVEWCEENMTGHWRLFTPTFTTDRPFNLYFMEETDAIFFKMRWLG